MEFSNPAAGAGAPTGGDWRSLLHRDGRGVMVKQIMKTLRQNLPHTDSKELLSRLQNIAKGFEQKFYEAAPSKDSYLRKLVMLSLYLEKGKPNQNTRCQAPGLPPQGNNPGQSSAVSLISRQQTLMPNTSTYVHASSPPSLGQSLAGVDQTSAHNMSWQSIIPQAQLMAMQTGSWSSIHQNPLNTVEQCQQPPQFVEVYQQHTQLYLHQQPSIQQTQLPQQPIIPLQQQLLGQQPNVCQNQLSQEQSSAADMQHQHRQLVQSNNLLNTQLVTLENNADRNEDKDFNEACNALSPLEELYSPYSYVFTGSVRSTFSTLSEPASDTQMVNNNDENVRCTILTAAEEPNYFSVSGKATNLKKRKFDGSSSSAHVLGQPTSVLVDGHCSTPAWSSSEIPEGASRLQLHHPV